MNVKIVRLTATFIAVLLVIIAASSGTLQAGDCDCGKCEDNGTVPSDSYNCASSGSPCLSRDYVNVDQLCSGDWFANSCAGVSPKTVLAYSDYQGDQMTVSQSGYVCNNNGSLFFGGSTPPEGYVVGSIEVSGGCKRAEANTCVCFKGEPEDITSTMDRCKSCL